MYRFDKYVQNLTIICILTSMAGQPHAVTFPGTKLAMIETSIDEIWHGENMHIFREHQNDVCGTCDALRLKHLNSA